MKTTLILFFLLCSASFSDTLPTVTLAWDAPAGGNATRYRIYMGERSAVLPDGSIDLSLYVGHVELGDQLSVPVFLNHPQTYFAVTAVNQAGESQPASELLVTNSGGSFQISGLRPR